MKKTLLVMCLLVALSGTVQAEVFSEVDDFDKTKYVYSYFRLTDVSMRDVVKERKGPVVLEVKHLIFRKNITTNPAEYLLIFRNTEIGVAGENRFSSYNEFLVKFDDDENEIYTLPKRGSAVVDSSIIHEIVLSVPKNVVDKILSSNKVTLRIPLNPKYNDTTRSTIRSLAFDIREDILNEWRQVIQAE